MSLSLDPIRTLFLADAVFEDRPGDSRAAARELALGLTQRGHEVTFLVPSKSPVYPEDEQHGLIRIVRYGGSGKGLEFIRRGQEACAHLCAQTAFDIVHTHFAYSSVGPLRAVPKSIPRIRTFHGPWDEEGWLEESQTDSLFQMAKAAIKRRVRYSIEARSLSNSAKVLTLSKCLSQLAQEHYNVKPEKMLAIPGGTDVVRFCLPDDKAAVRDRLGLPKDRRILLSVRRLAPRMGLDNLIKSMTAVIKRHRDVLLLVGGKGLERDRLNGIIKARGLESHVRLIGFIPDEDLAAYYQASDLFVHPAVALKGCGLVVTEVLACGVPVIGTPVGAIPEILGGLAPQLICGGTDSTFLAVTIDAFLEGTWSKRLTPQHLRKYVEDKYTWSRHVEDVEAVYRDVLKQPRTISSPVRAT